MAFLQCSFLPLTPHWWPSAISPSSPCLRQDTDQKAAHIGALRTGSSSAGVRSASVPVTLGAISRASLLLGLAPVLSSCFLFPTTCGTLPPGSSAGPFVVVCIFTYLSVFGSARAPRPHRLFSRREGWGRLSGGGAPLVAGAGLGCLSWHLRLPHFGAQAQSLGYTGLAAPRHAGSQQGLNPWLPHGQLHSSPASQQGGPKLAFPLSRSEAERIRPSPLPTPARQEGCWCSVTAPLRLTLGGDTWRRF